MTIRKKLPKLVRDNVPEEIVRDNFIPVWHFADQEEYVDSLKLKLLEEFEELMTDFSKFMDGDYSELADVLDVLDCLLMEGKGPATHVGHEEVASQRTLKAKRKGKFYKHIVLENILDRRELNEND